MNRADGEESQRSSLSSTATRASEPATDLSRGTSDRPGAAPPSNARHVIIVGFGVAGRSVVNNVIERGVSYTVIETNTATVSRCAPSGLNIIQGDARHPAILRRAGIERATDVAVTVPNDRIALEILQQARLLNPTARIIARCTFVSSGMEALNKGADETVVAEQVVAAEFGRVIAAALEASSS
jgi:monovalent cation:H+ antiporter-2, CPA2 family